MRKACIFIAIIFATVGITNGAVRDEKAVSRNTNTSITSRTTQNAKTVSSRTTSNKNISRTAAPSRATTTVRSTQQSRTARPSIATRNAPTISTARASTTNTKTQRATVVKTRNTRSAVTPATQITTKSPTFDADYNTCRDAYFTCMDQFCAAASDTYRRCICSPKLSSIQSRERTLEQTAEHLTDFKNLNLEIVNKTADEVTAMLSATTGESTQAKTSDKSDSAKQLLGISEVLAQSKQQSLSTQGTLDIAGDINSLWSTSDLAGSANIANLTGEALYNAVHAQCSEMVIDRCASPAIQMMVTTAYGMYIENDCSILSNTLSGQKNEANKNIRDTERELHLARLENYNAHNSTNINDCIAQVRADITADSACGPDYIHCLDVTGIYLNRETGEPIYTANFYQLENMTSLSGDTLTNQSNRLLVTELNRKRSYAKRALDTCRDISDDVWDEFMRQAVSEIYQGQQERVRKVKNECLEVVNKCYDEKNETLKDFSNIKEQVLLGQRIELSEALCKEKLDTCSNLYGGGPSGFSELLVAMKNLTTQTVANDCLNTLREYAKEICSVQSNDTLHAYPYACRTYYPGYAKQATNPECNNINTQEVAIKPTARDKYPRTITGPYSCKRTYNRCKEGYYLYTHACYTCPEGYSCPVGTQYSDLIDQDCKGYVGSLYQKLIHQASQSCVKLSENSTNSLPATVLEDVNTLMTEIRQKMGQELNKECERLGGTWRDRAWSTNIESNRHDSDYRDYQYRKFYNETNANTAWGYCAWPTAN